MRSVRRHGTDQVRRTRGKSANPAFNLKDNPEEILIEHHAPEVVAKTGYQPNEKQVNLADDPKFARKRMKWKLCCSPKCASWRIPSVLGPAPGLSPKYPLSGGIRGRSRKSGRLLRSG